MHLVCAADVWAVKYSWQGAYWSIHSWLWNFGRCWKINMFLWCCNIYTFIHSYIYVLRFIYFIGIYIYWYNFFFSIFCIYIYIYIYVYLILIATEGHQKHLFFNIGENRTNRVTESTPGAPWNQKWTEKHPPKPDGAWRVRLVCR